jgi:methyltransferase (TIGR00027 family)
MEQGQISLTAQEVARIRRELERPGDGTAGAAEELRFLATLGDGPALMMRPYLASRTAFFDDSVVAAQQEGIPQIVLVGAGYDGRALRFRSSRFTFFELDHPATQADKLARLQALDIDIDDVRFGGLDFVIDDASQVLAQLGHRADLRTLYMCEGVAVYLAEPVLRRLLRALWRQAAPGSVLAVSFAIITKNQEFEALRATWEERLARLGEEPRTRPTEMEVYRLLEDEGWRANDIVRPDNPEFGPDASESVFVCAVPSWHGDAAG